MSAGFAPKVHFYLFRSRKVHATINESYHRGSKVAGRSSLSIDKYYSTHYGKTHSRGFNTRVNVFWIIREYGDTHMAFSKEGRGRESLAGTF